MVEELRVEDIKQIDRSVEGNIHAGFHKVPSYMKCWACMNGQGGIMQCTKWGVVGNCLYEVPTRKWSWLWCKAVVRKKARTKYQMRESRGVMQRVKPPKRKKIFKQITWNWHCPHCFFTSFCYRFLVFLKSNGQISMEDVGLLHLICCQGLKV